MLPKLELKIFGALIAAALLAGFGYWVSTRYDAGVKDGRMLERAAYRMTSDAAVIKRDLEFVEVTKNLKIERANRETDKLEHEKKFAQYVADVRAGRVAGFSGLRVSRSNLCAPRAEETAGTGRAEDQTTARLPREIEEGLLGFANDRDEIIAAFEAFKQEVRISGCFKSESTP